MAIADNNENTPDTLRVFKEAPHMYLILSPALTILTGSAVYLETTNKKQSDITGKYIFDVFPVRDHDPEESTIKYSLQQVLNTKKSHQLPVIRFDIPHPDNKDALLERYWFTTNTPVLNEAGDIQYIIHHTQNVTEQILAEQHFKQTIEQQNKVVAQFSKQMEKLFFEIPARIAMLTGPDLVFEFVNPNFKKLFPGRNVLDKPLLKALPELANHPVLKDLERVYLTGETFEGKEIPVSFAQHDGGEPELYYFNFVYQARFDEYGKIYGLISFSYDITELVKARQKVEKNEKELLSLNDRLVQANEEILATNEELNTTNEDLYKAQTNLQKLNNKLEDRVTERTNQLQQSQREAVRERDKLNRFFMQAPAGICVLDGADMVFELVNSRYQQFFPERELLGKSLFEALPELKGSAIQDILKEVYLSGKTYEGVEIPVQLSQYANGPTEERYFNFTYQTRLDTEDKVDGIFVFAYEVTETVLNRRREQETEARFRFMLNAIPQQVWTASPEGALDYVNQVVVDDFGYTVEAIVGHGWQEFIHPDDLPDCLQKWIAALQNGNEYMVEFRLKFKDGQYKWHLGRAVPLIEDGKIMLWLGTNTNIDFQKNNEQRKDEFLSIASHELKTPLTSIKAFNQLMQRTSDTEKQNNFVKKSADHILRLEKLINDLLDVTKINAGKMGYNMQQFNFRYMLADSIESVQQTTATHKIILDPGEDVLLTGDLFRLEQVVNNFLNNAIKYSPDADRVIVNYHVDNGDIIVSVKDFGIGIAGQDANRLFERYFRVDNTAMHFEGLGLGLFISSEILKRHHGKFWIESELGKGSTFYFRLPLSVQ